jgi:two-component system phosphate regulon sensor histidine kinase PhoR
MDFSERDWIILLAGIESFQLVLLGFFLFRRRRLMRQLGRVAEDLADGRQPGSYFLDGPPLLTRLAGNLERIGARLDNLQRRQQEEDFNLNVLLANMVEGVMVVDRRHVVRLVNEELVTLFDLKASPLNKTLLESLRESEVELIVREAMLRNEPQRQEVVLQSTSAHSSNHFEVSAVPIRTQTGEVDGAVLVFHDITRIKHLEVMRREFVANVSHEFRTPLAIFRGYLETLMDQPDLPADDSRRILEAMRRHSERLNALVEDLLILTRLESKQIRIEFSIIRLDAFLRQIVQDWKQHLHSEAAAIELELPENLPSLEVDPLRLEQIILNLLENAVAYSNPPRRIVISAASANGSMEIRVADNGIGIPPADLPHVFERFYRVDKGRSRVSGSPSSSMSSRPIAAPSRSRARPAPAPPSSCACRSIRKSSAASRFPGSNPRSPPASGPPRRTRNRGHPGPSRKRLFPRGQG